MKQTLRKTSRKLNNTKGFSLAEMLLALGILIILMALATVGVLHYQKVLKGMEMDNHAKQIFLAAQNHLTTSALSGELDLYRKTCAPGGSVMSSEIEGLGAAITDEHKPSDFPESSVTWTSGEYFYIIYNPSGGGGNTALDRSILKYMLPFGATEETLRTGGKYVIEYNPKTATVYSVFYTESKNSLTYTDVAALNTAGGRGSSTEARKVRREYSGGIIGYYGGAVAMKEAGTLLEEPTITVKNGETLEVIITDPNYFKKNAEGLQYKTKLQVTIHGVFSGHDRVLKFEPETEGILGLPVGHAAWWTGVEKVRVDGQDVLQYTLTLDDITKSDMHFADLFENGVVPEQRMIPGENLEISIAYVESEGGADLTEVYETKKTNSLFGDSTNKTEGSGKSHTVTAEISAFRHLENMEQQISNLRKDYTTVGQVLVTEAVQTEDLDWTDYYAKAGEVKQITFCQGVVATVIRPDVGTFFSVMNSRLTSYDGKGHTISNLVIDNKATKIDGTSNGGMFRMASSSDGQKPFEIKDLNLKGWNVTAERNAALLVAEVANTISDFSVSGITVTGCKVTSKQSTAGGLCGISGNTGKITIENVYSDEYVINNLKIKAATSAGGLLGEASCTGSVTVTGMQLKDSNVSGTENTSMGVAQVNNTVTGLTMSNIKVSDCKVTSSPGTAGGVCGSASNTDNTSISQVDVENLKVQGYHTAAGVLGQSSGADSITIKNVSVDSIKATATYDSTESTSLKIVAGGVAGYLNCSGTATIQNITVTNPLIESANNSAGVLAEIDSASSSSLLSMSNVLVDGGSSGCISSTWLSQGNAGGLIAYAGRKANISNCASSVRVEQTGTKINTAWGDYFSGYAGGLVGELGADDNTIVNCYTGGRTSNGKYALGQKVGDGYAEMSEANVFAVDTAGGLIGMISGETEINRCYSTCSVSVKNNRTINISSAGGLVGGHILYPAPSVTYEDCYATGLVRGQTYRKVHIGALVGFASTGTWKNCSYLTDPWKAWNEVQGKATPSDISSLRAVGNYETNPSEISARSYDDMKAIGTAASGKNVETHNYDTSLTEKYPFAAVNKVGADDTSVDCVHYGDWPVKWKGTALTPEDPGYVIDPTKPPTGLNSKLMFGYVEKVGDKYLWRVVGAILLPDHSYVYREVQLPADVAMNQDNIGKEVSSGLEYEYGFLWYQESGKNSLNQEFNKGVSISDSYYPRSDEYKITIGTTIYVLYCYNKSESGVKSSPPSKDNIKFWFDTRKRGVLGSEEYVKSFSTSP